MHERVGQTLYRASVWGGKSEHSPILFTAGEYKIEHPETK